MEPELERQFRKSYSGIIPSQHREGKSRLVYRGASKPIGNELDFESWENQFMIRIGSSIIRKVKSKVNDIRQIIDE